MITAKKYCEPKTESKKKGKLKSYAWEWTEYYRGVVEATSEAEAVEKINEDLESTMKGDFYDGGDLGKLEVLE